MFHFTWLGVFRTIQAEEFLFFLVIGSSNMRLADEDENMETEIKNFTLDSEGIRSISSKTKLVDYARQKAKVTERAHKSLGNHHGDSSARGEIRCRFPAIFGWRRQPVSSGWLQR